VIDQAIQRAHTVLKEVPPSSIGKLAFDLTERVQAL
jgi:hypothetical protein